MRTITEPEDPTAKIGIGMSIALTALSHSPLMGRNDPAAEIVTAVDSELTRAREFVETFNPDLIVIFAPDHYNGVFYDMMPQFCIGRAASSVGDYGSEAGPLSVDWDAANHIANRVLEAEIDVAVSDRMTVDHGFAQPLELLTGSISRIPTVPIFVNSVSAPFSPIRRVRLLGEAVGRALGALDRRVMLIGSGGLSHDPPVPQFATASPEVRERLIDGRGVTAEQRAEREARVLAAGQQFAAGTAQMRALNPEWDNRVLDILASGELAEMDDWAIEDFISEAGNSSHEVRSWIAAYAALSANGGYSMNSRFYRDIPEWISGFSITTATPAEKN